MIRTIRPHKLFDLVELSDSERIARVKIPRRTENWLLETFLILAAMKIVNAKTIFEFGTFRGATTLNLALNMPPEGRIYTFDLDPDLKIEQDPLSAEISRQHFAQERMEFEGVPLRPEIIQLTGNSHTFDPSPYAVDLVFVDGGHDRATIDADTRSAFRMARRCIVWHDYGNLEYPDVKTYLDLLPRPAVLTGDQFCAPQLFHVEDSRLAFWFADEKLEAQLLR